MDGTIENWYPGPDNMPYVYAKELRELGKRTGLNPSLMEVVDICTPTFPNRNSSPESAGQEIRTTVAMGVSGEEGPTARVAAMFGAVVLGSCFARNRQAATAEPF